MINWDESPPVDVIDITGYLLYADDGFNGNFNVIYDGTGLPNTFEYQALGLTTGLPYRFKLIALNING